MTDSSKQPSFEQALQQLEQLVNELEQGDLPLEESLKKFEQAIALSRASQAQLQQAEHKVKLLIEQNGEQQLQSQEANE
ncbi:exodeoxyribonuclease VII small subunit [Idiomarina sp. OT37-5b]|jgi:exodeoxyribonuclease VII small subunit|uniref:Exodeoxyribonuclease 7 small subunit n=1 Tax=Idiomarina aquatica TaxID=1327752 RepID=A0AA94EDK1_9GAMM|nr:MULTISPECIES: exodeoxyribonuclease VII small subunit [Idiomarina]AVJ56778.1 exodeoxyribonuclease VII small subunit [Idiomarina sp. OT37-5b]RUO42504.1 exodeoxyribonuclease VII small subunit [Idiomarina aquatica]